MSENLMCKDHKAGNEKYRERYDIVFKKDKKEQKGGGENEHRN